MRPELLQLTRVVLVCLTLAAGCERRSGTDTEPAHQSQGAAVATAAQHTNPKEIDAWYSELKRRVPPDLRDPAAARSAAATVEEAIAAARAKHSAKDRRLALGYGLLADVHAARMEWLAAAQAREHQLSVLDAASPGDHEAISTTLYELYRALLAARQVGQAQPYMDRLVTLVTRQHGASSAALGRALEAMGALLAAADAHASAEQRLRQALAIYQAGGASTDSVLRTLVMVLEAQGKTEEAAILQRDQASKPGQP